MRITNPGLARHSRGKKPPCTPSPIGTGPAGETCRTCKHLARIQYANTYLKCGKMRAVWTGGAGTDVRAGWAACREWEPNG